MSFELENATFEKREFAKAVKYLGKEVGQIEVRLLWAQVSAIEGFPPLSTKKDLMRFLELVDYRSFCPNFSTVVSPLTDVLKVW